MKEMWTSIEGFKNYKISTLGRVLNIKTDNFKKPDLYNGYYHITLYDGKYRRKYRIHILVAKYFISNKDNKEIVNHKNGIKTDNNINNLEWVSRSENTKHSYVIGLQKIKYGTDNVWTKLKEKDVLEIFFAKGTHQKIANHFNISNSCVNDIKHKKIWKQLLNNLEYYTNNNISFKYLKEEDLKNNKSINIDDILQYERKTITNFNNYSIDIMGNIYSHNRNKYMKLKEDVYGYVRVSLSNQNNKSKFNVHRLVAEAFIPNVHTKKEVNHKNGIKTDNRVENLEWVTSSENTKHSFNIGLNISNKGEKNGMSKLTKDDILEIYHSNETSITLSKKFNIDRKSINRIKRKERWKHILDNISN